MMLVTVFNNSFCICKLCGLRPGTSGKKQITIASSMYVSDWETNNPSINCCAVDGADDDLMAIGGDDGLLRKWTVSEAEGRLRCTLEHTYLPAHTAPIMDCSFSESGHLVATASKDGSCRVWSASTGAIMCELLAGAVMPSSTSRSHQNNKITAKLIVRACKFIGNDSLISVQSATRGSAFAAKWTLAASRSGCAPLAAALAVSRRISRHPVSAVCLGGDFIAHGDVEGFVAFIRVNNLTQHGGSVKAHDLPVTALVVANSHATIRMLPCALSVSADYTLATTPLAYFEPSTYLLAAAFVALLAFWYFPGRPGWSP